MAQTLHQRPGFTIEWGKRAQVEHSAICYRFFFSARENKILASPSLPALTPSFCLFYRTDYSEKISESIKSRSTWVNELCSGVFLNWR